MVILSLAISVLICIFDIHGIGRCWLDHTHGCWQVNSSVCYWQHWTQGQQSSTSVLWVLSEQTLTSESNSLPQMPLHGVCQGCCQNTHREQNTVPDHRRLHSTQLCIRDDSLTGHGLPGGKLFLSQALQVVRWRPLLCSRDDKYDRPPLSKPA